MASPAFCVAIVAVCLGLLLPQLGLGARLHNLQLTLLQAGCPSSCVCDNTVESVSCHLITNLSESAMENFQEYFVIHQVRQFQIAKSLDIAPLLKLTVQSVQNLNLSDNMIQVIPSRFFAKFVDMRTLDLSYNDVDTIEESAFEKHSDSLHALNISYNKLSAIPADAFQNLIHLKHLDLSNNRLERIPSDLFSSLKQLTSLDLSFNKLSFLSSKHLAGLTNLKSLYLHNNNFRTFHSNIVPSLSKVPLLDIAFNPFDCSCAVSSLITMVKEGKNIVSSDDTTCSTTTDLKGRRLADVEVEYLNCSHPIISNLSPPQTIQHLLDLYLSCEVTGYPNPAVIWQTPWGELFAHHSYHPIIGDSADSYYIRNAYLGKKIFVSSVVEVMSNGSLHITKFRGAFAGNFTCFALTPLGNVSATVKVGIYAPLHSVYIASLMMGGISAGCFALLGAIVAVILTLVRRVCCRDRFMEDEKKEKVPEIVITVASDDENTNCGSSYRGDDESHDTEDDDDDSSPDSPLTSIRSETVSETSSAKHHSPTSESPPQGWLTSNMIEFKCGVERKMETVRSHAKAIKDSSEKKMENVRRNVKTMKDTGEKKIETIRTNVKSIKDSGTVYMQSIKDTTGQAANKVRAGVVLSVETVKYTVQSMKELCGTGEMGGQTISMMSVETDIDSNESKEVVRSVTFV